MNTSTESKLALSQKRSELQERVMVWQQVDPTRSQELLAKSACLNPATLSTFLTGKCAPKTDHNVIEKLEAFFRLADQRVDLLPDPEFVLTRQAKRILNFISLAHVTRGINILHSSSGCGKTTTVKAYMKDNTNTYYIPVNPMIRSKTEFFKALAWTILGRKSIGCAGMVFDEIATKCSEQGALIFVDDAHLLYTERGTNDSAFEIIRTLNDRGIGFIVSGNGSLRDKVTQTNKEEFYQQLASRSKIQQIPHQFTEADVGLVVESVLQGKTCPKDVFEYLYEMTNKFYGSLRIAVETLKLAALTASSMNEKLMVSHLKLAADQVLATLKPEAKGNAHAKKRNQGTPDTHRKQIIDRGQSSTVAC